MAVMVWQGNKYKCKGRGALGGNTGTTVMAKCAIALLAEKGKKAASALDCIFATRCKKPPHTGLPFNLAPLFLILLDFFPIIS